ncbi:MAG TPA: hypothetical protein VG478_02705 [Acidimicrobiales bacterium]|nr:hypothetical protein [Acidimicrobiales bacterium]
MKSYLEALEATKPKRGRKRTPDSIKKRLTTIDKEYAAADALNRLNLAQERMNLEHELTAMDRKVDIGALESAFVKSARSYSERKGISYAAWRQVGVEPAVLKKAGISRAM